MRITIRHQLSVTPPAGTAHAVMHLLVCPSDGATQKVESWDIEAPGIDNAAVFQDAYGNRVHLVNQARPEEPMVVTVSGTVVTTNRHGVVGRISGENVPSLFKRITPLTRASVTLYSKFRGSKESRIDVLHALMARVGETLGVDSEGAQSQSQMSADGSQSQSQSSAAPDTPSVSDLVHTFIGGARALDIPARYVTGYLAADPDGEDGHSGYHAWAEAYDDGLGWVGFDPLLQMCPTERHVRMAVGLDELSSIPLRSAPEGDGVEVVAVSVAAE